MRLGLAGDTMLGRGVAERLAHDLPSSIFSPELIDLAQEADLLVVNLECCISERGSEWPDPAKPFFFRAPPQATEALNRLGVDCVTLANNHALDFGEVALLDTLAHLEAAGISWVGAGVDAVGARAARVIEASGFRLAVLGVTDHPESFAAGDSRPGVAYAELGDDLPDWLVSSIAEIEADAILVAPHWGPNMVMEPIARVRAAADALVAAGATLVAGHSAHVFHGVAARVLFDLGDFVDDYLVDRHLRNDLGLFFFVEFGGGGRVTLEAIPLKLEFCHTRLASGEESLWIERRFARACAELGTDVSVRNGRLCAELATGDP